jgi:hypothetical protein
MVLKIDRGHIVPGETTHPEEAMGVNPPTYNLQGEVRITIDGFPLPPKRLGRTVSTADPNTKNDFFYVYRIGRLAEGTPPPIRTDWQDFLTVRLKLSAGKLVVSKANPQSCTFEDGDGNPAGEARELATQISYTSDIPAGSYVEVSADGGKIRMTTTSDLIVDILAECDCGSEPVSDGARLPGFDDVFELYDQRLTPHFRVIPRKATFLTGPQVRAAGRGPDSRTPGPDCPPTEHPEG